MENIHGFSESIKCSRPSIHGSSERFSCSRVNLHGFSESIKYSREYLHAPVRASQVPGIPSIAQGKPTLLQDEPPWLWGEAQVQTEVIKVLSPSFI
jgi:hypothetical protein